MSLAWTVEFEPAAAKYIRKLDRPAQLRLLDAIDKLVTSGDPRSRLERLSGILSDLHKFRVGDYRILCEVRDTEFIVIVVKVGHRRDVYR